jgi:hypothetical protein
LNRDALSGDELKRAQMLQAVKNATREESTNMFVVQGLSGRRKRKPVNAPKPNINKEIVNNKIDVNPQCLSEYPAICFGDASVIFSELLGGMQPSQFTGIFSGTQTQLDPFCSIEESERELETKGGANFDYFTEEYTEGNIFDLVVAEDGMIRSRPQKQVKL